MQIKTNIVEILQGMGACDEAVEWAKQFGDDAERAWAECHRGDWMLWLVAKKVNFGAAWSDERKPLVACCLDCAETVRHLWPAYVAPTISAAIAILRDWIAGKVSIEEAKTATKKLAVAAYAVYATDDVYAVYAAIDVVAAAAAVTIHPWMMQHNMATPIVLRNRAAIEQNQRQTANIVREYFTCPS